MIFGGKFRFALPVLGLIFVSPSALADLDIVKTKVETKYQLFSDWQPKNYAANGTIAFFAEAKKGMAPEEVRLMLVKREPSSSNPWPWRDCNVVELDIDGQISPVKERYPPQWDYTGVRKANLFLESSIETIEEILVSKNASFKVCDDVVQITPSLRIDLMKFRDLYRKRGN